MDKILECLKISKTFSITESTNDVTNVVSADVAKKPRARDLEDLTQSDIDYDFYNKF